MVNNAGIVRDRMIFNMTEEEWDAVIAVHLKGGFAVTRAAAPRFREQRWGRFINMTSTSGLVGNVGQANYAAAKLGIVGLTRVTALDMARYNVTANCISPFAWTRLIGTIPTDTPEQKARVAKLEKMSPARRRAAGRLPRLRRRGRSDAGRSSGCGARRSSSSPSRGRCASIHHADGWTPERLAETFPGTLGHHLVPLESSAAVLQLRPPRLTRGPRGARPRGGPTRARPPAPTHGQPEGRPLEPAFRVDELRLEEIDGDAELEEPPVVHPRLEPARRALDAARAGRPGFRSGSTRHRSGRRGRGTAATVIRSTRGQGRSRRSKSAKPAASPAGAYAGPRKRARAASPAGTTTVPMRSLPSEPIEGRRRQALPRLAEQALAVEALRQRQEPRRRRGLAGVEAGGDRGGVRVRAVHDLAAGAEGRKARDVAVGRVPRGAVVEPERGREEEDAVRAAAEGGPEAIELMAARHLLQRRPRRLPPARWRPSAAGRRRSGRIAAIATTASARIGRAPRVGARGDDPLDDHAGARARRPRSTAWTMPSSRRCGLDRGPASPEEPDVAEERRREHERQRGEERVERPPPERDRHPRRQRRHAERQEHRPARQVAGKPEREVTPRERDRPRRGGR